MRLRSGKIIGIEEKLDPFSLSNEKSQEITLSESIKVEIKKNVTLLKGILKDDKEFANTIINDLCLLKNGEGYAGMFYCKGEKKYPHNYQLSVVMDELAYLITCSHELTQNELNCNYPLDEKSLYNYPLDEKSLCNAIEKEIIQAFDSHELSQIGEIDYNENLNI